MGASGSSTGPNSPLRPRKLFLQPTIGNPIVIKRLSPISGSGHTIRNPSSEHRQPASEKSLQTQWFFGGVIFAVFASGRDVALRRKRAISIMFYGVNNLGQKQRPLQVPFRNLPIVNQRNLSPVLSGSRKTFQRSDWNDWHWQERNCITSLGDLTSALALSQDFLRQAMGSNVDRDFHLKVTPHFVEHLRDLKQSLGEESIRPLLRTLLPTANEDRNSFTQIDGMGEDRTGEHKLISSLYADRGLLFITNRCPVHCRYCFRRRKINDTEHTVSNDEVFEAIDRIRNDKSIRDVILSGGDPLSVSDNRLDQILDAIYSIDHVSIVRIDTKFATVLPQRFSASLLSVLSKRKPLYMNLHFTHASEISRETRQVCNKLADAGIVLGAYIPLLKGVNDDRDVLKELCFDLVKIRVRPYYLVQNVTNKWNRHFQVPIERGLELIDGLQGELSGVALPTYIVYLPNAGGKVPLQPNYLVSRTDQGYVFRNFQNKPILYMNAFENEADQSPDFSDQLRG